MDVLKKELEQAFSKQVFDKKLLNKQVLSESKELAKALSGISNGCIVLSDMSEDKSYFTTGTFGNLLGLVPEEISGGIINSLDEDCIYSKIHPEDLVDKRMLELEFFLFLCGKPVDEC
jgi:hypothetical protein